jgi:hypothetical protein
MPHLSKGQQIISKTRIRIHGRSSFTDRRDPDACTYTCNNHLLIENDTDLYGPVRRGARQSKKLGLPYTAQLDC